MQTDEWGEVYNTKENFQELASFLLAGMPVALGWTDQEDSHLDLLLALYPLQFGLLQRGQQGEKDLFVSIVGQGAHGFDAQQTDTHPSYIGEKLRLGENETTNKLTELINGVRTALADLGPIVPEPEIFEQTSSPIPEERRQLNITKAAQ